MSVDVNNYWRPATEEGCGFGQEDLATADRDAIRASGLKLGLSTHDERELETALAARPDYIALGPVYTTILKQMMGTARSAGAKRMEIAHRRPASAIVECRRDRRRPCS